MQDFLFGVHLVWPAEAASFIGASWLVDSTCNLIVFT
jgi:hypothetical protein